MKHFIIISTLILIFSCSDEARVAPTNSELIIGEWRFVEAYNQSDGRLITEDEIENDFAVFTKDSLYLYSKGKIEIKTTWKIIEDSIFVEITNDPQAWVSHIPFIIKEISSDYLEVENTQKPISTIKLKKK